MIRTNKERLVIQTVMGKIHHPTLQAGGAMKLCHDGSYIVSPSVGGITYNVKIGDSVYAMDCDHVEPGVSLRNSDDRENGAMNALACIGNTATVVSGEARGAKGIVTGFHGGIEHTLIYFSQDDLEKMLPNDSIVIRAHGQGMKLLDAPEIVCTGIDPTLLEKLDIKIVDGVMEIAVAAVVPAHLMGAGQGSGNAYSGDYDIMTADWQEVCKHNLDKLRYGDIVLLENCDNTFGRGYLTGAVSIGVVVHSDSTVMGHGPGVSTIFTCKKPLIQGKLDAKANLADILQL